MICRCTNCGKTLEVDNSYIGRKGQCPGCQKKFIIQDHHFSNTKACPMCGEEILAVAQKCKHCGEYFNADGTVAYRTNPAVYILLAFFFGGLGVHNFYKGKQERNVGFAHLSLTLLAFIFMIGWGSGGIGAALVVGAINSIWIIVEIINGESPV